MTRKEKRKLEKIGVFFFWIYFILIIIQQTFPFHYFFVMFSKMSLLLLLLLLCVVSIGVLCECSLVNFVFLIFNSFLRIVLDFPPLHAYSLHCSDFFFFRVTSTLSDLFLFPSGFSSSSSSSSSPGLNIIIITNKKIIIFLVSFLFYLHTFSIISYHIASSSFSLFLFHCYMFLFYSGPFFCSLLCIILSVLAANAFI
jgi:hypothetical protein